MKKLILSLAATLAAVSLLQAQEPDYRFGKVSEEELRMERYDRDPDAEAVILYEELRTYFLIGNQFTRMTDYFIRIKVLKAEGKEYADINLPYVFQRENYANLDAVAYNLVDGKIVKTPLKKQYLFREQVGDEQWMLKFSIPEVREGTVIEYRYRMNSDFVTYIPSVVVQHDIPTVRMKATVEIPEYLRFNVNTKGYLSINMRENTIAGRIAGTDVPYNVREITTEGRDIPALKKEPFVWNRNEFRSMIDFELSQIAMPFSDVQNFSLTWKDVNEALAETDFNSNIRMGNPFKEETAAIVARNLAPRQTLHELLRLVQSHMKWDGKYRLMSSSPRNAADKGTGNSAEINSVLMAAVKDAGFDVVPLLLNPRSRGRLPLAHPSFDGISTFILRVTLDDGKFAYLDGTDPDSDVDLLPTDLLVDRARIYGVSGDVGWCDLSRLAPGNTHINMTLGFDPELSVHGRITERYTNVPALRCSSAYGDARSEEEYVEALEEEHHIRIDSLTINGLRSAHLTQEFTMTREPETAGDFIYLNATIIPFLTENPFKSPERKYPVEFDNPASYTMQGVLRLPEGYVVEELPRAARFNAFDGDITCFYMAQATNGVIQFNMRFNQKRLIFLPEEYADLQAFYGAVVNICNSRIVLRKQQ
ncbi:DUF3857 domain-containing protein [uncultured Alistipes sp.]|uniref:DUF3857 domain-containing protein n=1 Tax=uncultured Alistipes sp. TaxID=538949 RepID=UPI0028053DA0|nr:DUF3857 domain-containing protein [uncultured Alistipes sp.]